MDHESPYLTTYPNAKKKVENMARTEVIVFKNFQVFGNVIKKRFLVLDAFRNAIKTKPKDKTEKYNSKNPNSVTVMIIIKDV